MAPLSDRLLRGSATIFMMHRFADRERGSPGHDPDVLRSGEYHLTSGLDGRAVGLAAAAAAWRPLRLFLGNDILGIGRKP